MPFLTEEQVVAQLSAQHTKYTNDPAISGTQVKTDHDARVSTANETHSEVTNATFSTLSGTEAPGSRVTGKVYAGGNVVAPVNATYMEAQVRAALDADTLFTHGGPYGGPASYGADENTGLYSRPSPYVDSLTLIQGSLLTGEKLF